MYPVKFSLAAVERVAIVMEPKPRDRIVAQGAKVAIDQESSRIPGVQAGSLTEEALLRYAVIVEKYQKIAISSDNPGISGRRGASGKGSGNQSTGPIWISAQRFEEVYPGGIITLVINNNDFDTSF